MLKHTIGKNTNMLNFIELLTLENGTVINCFINVR